MLNIITGRTGSGKTRYIRNLATEIAKNHIIEKAYKTIDIPDGNFPKNTMNRRVITMSSKTGKIVLDETSTIIELDIETENGVIHAIDKENP